MTPDNAAVLAGIVLAMLWPIHQHLTIRALRYSLHRQREQLHQHHRAIIQLQATAPEPPTSAGQPMPTVTKVTATISGETSLQRHTRYDSPELCPDPDPTLRLRRPPALSDIEYVLSNATRPLTRTEIASMLGVGTMDILTDLRRLMLAGKITMTGTHTAGEPGYTTPPVDPTVRLSRMPVLPGLVP